MEKKDNFKSMLTEEMLIKESENWNAHEWIEYLSNQNGVMTLDEFRDFNEKIIDNMFSD